MCIWVDAWERPQEGGGRAPNTQRTSEQPTALSLPRDTQSPTAPERAGAQAGAGALRLLGPFPLLSESCPGAPVCLSRKNYHILGALDMLIGLVCGVKEHLGTERKQSLSHMGASRPEALLCGLRIGRLGCSRGRELARVPCARRTVHFCGARSPEAGSAGKTETGAEGTLCPVRRPGSRPALPRRQLVGREGSGRPGRRPRGCPWACAPASSARPLPLIHGIFYMVPSAEISREYRQRCRRLK